MQNSIITANDPQSQRTTSLMSKSTQFEKSIQALENVVTLLEKGDVSLDDALKHFEKGVQLSKTCQTLLNEAEQKVEALMRQSGSKEEFQNE